MPNTPKRILPERFTREPVEKTVDRIEPFFVKNAVKSILDLGAGTGIYSKLLGDRGYKVASIDVKNRGIYSDVSIKEYDGRHLPFKDNLFDAVILIAVLHHTPHPEIILKEAIRVSKRLIVYEDAVTNFFQRYYTYVVDSYFNKEWFGHPHTNKSDKQWQALFKRLRLRLINIQYTKSWLFLFNPIYFLEKT